LAAHNARRKPNSMAFIETCLKPEHMPSIEATSVVFAGVLVWLSALVQNLSNASERGAKYVISDRSVSPPLQGVFGRATRTLANNIESALMWGAACGCHPRASSHDLDLTTICRGIYRRARRLCAFLLAQNPSRTVAGLAGRHGLLLGRRYVGRRPHLDR
jgi:hypothetical protein